MPREQRVSELAGELFAERYVDDDGNELAPIANLAVELREGGMSRRDILEQLYSLTQNACLVVYFGNVARLNRAAFGLPKISDLRTVEPKQVGIQLSERELSQLSADYLPSRIKHAFGVKNQKEVDNLTDLQLFGRIEFTNALLFSLKAAESVEEVESSEGIVFEGYKLYEELVADLDTSPVDAIRRMLETQDKEHLWELETLAEICLRKEDIKAIISVPTATI